MVEDEPVRLEREPQVDIACKIREIVGYLAAAVHAEDDEAGDHPWRVAAYAAELAKAVGWSAERCRIMELAAALHDVGKLGIPREILHKRLTHTARERTALQEHTRIGHELLSEHGEPVFDMAADIALHHHEKWDGSGYPDRLSGTGIPEAARIMAVVDVFDALTMARGGKRSWTEDIAMETLRGAAGTYFDPQLVAAFEGIQDRILDIKSRWDAKPVH